MSKLIKLNSVKYPGHEAIVDDEDYESLSSYYWYPLVAPKNNNIYAQATVNGNRIRMHRFILILHNYNIENILIDHVDQNGINNQKENLRTCTYSENKQNSRKPNHGKTAKYKGVTYRDDLKKFIATIGINSKHIYLGCFDIEEDAALVYNKKAFELFGEFASLNIIEK